jgi:DNA (cytosine-5)-methyltransferase 1
MIHCGDITQINGAKVPVVDTVIFGAPCQDLSVAGLRKGMKHGDLGDEETTRSGLFMDAVRIIKEMRQEDARNGRSGITIRPRYGIYENVPGALSSSGGDDWKAVLEELARIVDEGVTIPRPPKKWSTTGVIIGEGYSLAWRVMDAQFYGVPQRRRRIALVADFNGYTAAEILFSKVEHHGSTERTDSESSFGDIGGGSPEIQTLSEGLPRHTEQSKSKRKEPPTDASGSLGANDRLGADQYNAVILGDTVSTLGVNCGMSHGRQCVLEPTEVITFEPGIASREGGHIYEGVSGTLRANAGDNQMATAYTLKIRSGCEGGGKGALVQEDLSATLACNNDQYLFQPIYPEAVALMEAYQHHGYRESDTCGMITAGQNSGIRGDTPLVCYSFDPTASRDAGEYILEGVANPLLNGTCPGHKSAVCYSVENHPADSRVDIDESGKVQTLTSRMGTGGGNVPMVLALDRASFNQGKNAQYDFEISDKGVNSPLVAKGPGAVCYGIDQQGGKSGANYTQDVSPTILSDSHGTPHAVCYKPIVTKTRYIVRRLTPLECERLQGYPDGWTDIGDYIDSQGKKKTSSDAARYKALGNSIALPPWKWILKRLCACYERDATMASLFDGIGGFPYLWEQINGKGSCLWASEIEEFPIAVTKARIGE